MDLRITFTYGKFIYTDVCLVKKGMAGDMDCIFIWYAYKSDEDQKWHFDFDTMFPKQIRLIKLEHTDDSNTDKAIADTLERLVGADKLSDF